MEQKLIVILGPNRSLKTTKFEHIANARTTAYNISRGNSFIFLEHSTEQLNLQMRYFVVQIFHKAGDPVTMNLTMKTANESQETVFSFSTSNRNSQQRSSSQKLVNVKLSTVPPDEWVNVCIDLEYAVLKNLPDSAFVALTNFEITPTCLIRFVFMIPFPLRPENNGVDLPNKTRFQGLKSHTVLYAENVAKSLKSRNPGRSQGSMTKQTKSPLKPKRPNTAASNKKPKSDSFDNIEKSMANTGPNFDVEEDSDDGDDFITEPDAPKDDIDVQNGLPENEEEELELVYVDALKCYYCPNNQKYYQIDD